MTNAFRVEGCNNGNVKDLHEDSFEIRSFIGSYHSVGNGARLRLLLYSRRTFESTNLCKFYPLMGAHEKPDKVEQQKHDVLQNKGMRFLR